MQLLFETFALGDIFLDSDIMGNTLLRIPDRSYRSMFPEEFSVFPSIVKFPAPDPACTDGLPELPVFFGRHFPGFENPRVLTQNFGTRVSADLAKLAVDELDPSFGIGDNDRDRTLFDRLREFAQLCFCLLLIGDILHHAQHPDWTPCFVKGCVRLAVNISQFAAGLNDAIVDIIASPSSQRLLDGLFGTLSVFRVDQGKPAFVPLLQIENRILLGNAEDAAGLGCQDNSFLSQIAVPVTDVGDSLGLFKLAYVIL